MHLPSIDKYLSEYALESEESLVQPRLRGELKQGKFGFSTHYIAGTDKFEICGWPGEYSGEVNDAG